jgi:hypothetical protein
LLHISRVVRFATAGLLLLFLARPAAAQVQVGDASMNLNGLLSGGYSATYGNDTPSSHGLDLGGTATLSGFFHDPNFLSFNLSPYLDQSRADADYQSISNASGLNFGAGIFNGSHFPGSITYSKAYESEGSYAIPGLPNYTTHGNSDAFGINWSENVPYKPSLSFGFQRGSNAYSVYGTNDTGSSTFDSITVHSGYSIHGFGLGAFYQYGTSQSLIPQVFTSSTQSLTTDSSSNGFGFNISHLLPMRGGFSASFTRSSFDNEDQGYQYNGTVDNITTNAGFQPTEKLHLSLSGNYSDNLNGTLYQAAATAGVVLPPNTNQKSNSLDVLGVASYAFSLNFQAQGEVEQRDQTFLGESIGDTAFDGSIMYARPVLGGSFNVNTTAVDTRLDSTGQNTLGLTSTVNYSRRIKRWFVGGSFSYAQNAQTVLVTYTTGYYNYSANVRRRFRAFNWSASASGSRTALTAQPGTESGSQGYSTGLSFGRWASVTGTYSISNGNAIQTGAGLVTTPVPSPILPSSLLILYGGKSLSFGLASSPVRGLTIAASFSKSSSDTNEENQASWNKNEQFNAYLQYQFRKVYLTGGYARLSQSFSASTIPPANVSSYYIGISRWFNFF